MSGRYMLFYGGSVGNSHYYLTQLEILSFPVSGTSPQYNLSSINVRNTNTPFMLEHTVHSKDPYLVFTTEEILHKSSHITIKEALSIENSLINVSASKEIKASVYALLSTTNLREVYSDTNAFNSFVRNHANATYITDVEPNSSMDVNIKNIPIMDATGNLFDTSEVNAGYVYTWTKDGDVFTQIIDTEIRNDEQHAKISNQLSNSVDVSVFNASYPTTSLYVGAFSTDIDIASKTDDEILTFFKTTTSMINSDVEPKHVKRVNVVFDNMFTDFTDATQLSNVSTYDVCVLSQSVNDYVVTKNIIPSVQNVVINNTVVPFDVLNTQFVFKDNKMDMTANVAYYTKYSSEVYTCLLYTSPSPRDKRQSRMPSSA